MAEAAMISCETSPVEVVLDEANLTADQKLYLSTRRRLKIFQNITLTKSNNGTKKKNAKKASKAKAL